MVVLAVTVAGRIDCADEMSGCIDLDFMSLHGDVCNPDSLRLSQFVRNDS